MAKKKIKKKVRKKKRLKKKSINIRREKYKQNRLLGMNQYNAARAAGYSESYSRTHNDKIERATHGDISDALEQAGLTPKVKAQVVADIAINAKRIHGTDDNFVEVADANARLKAVELASKLDGSLNTNVKVEHSGNITIMNDIKKGNRIKEYIFG